MVNHLILRARLAKAVLAGVLLVALLVWVSGCWLFNLPPVAAFTATPEAGQAPLRVYFSALPSEDEDGEIVSWEWNFGDGNSKMGKNVDHTYQTEGSWPVTLLVTDDDDAQDTTQKTIYVTPAEPPGPTASFSLTPATGTSPLNVYVDGSASSSDVGPITSWEWDWGDGSTHTYGRTSAHSYYSATTRTYTVRLTVTAVDGKIGTATQSARVTVAGGTSTAENAPSARFAIFHDDVTQSPSLVYENHTVAPLQTWFDPEDSEAVTGRTLVSYTWTFGDGSSLHTINSTPVKHVYRTDDASEVFEVTLVVIDDDGELDSVTKTVKVYNYQPKAGFEIYDELGINTGSDEKAQTTQAEWSNPAIVPAGGDWIREDVTVVFNEVQTWSTTVWIRSLPPTLPAWVGDPVPVQDVEPQGTSTAKPTNFDDDSGEANLCFDPEGQGWDEVGPPYDDDTVMPAGWTNVSWGIERIEINWGDGTTQNYDYYDWVMHGGGQAGYFMHTYLVSGDTTLPATITVTAHDFLGAQGLFSRDIVLKKGL